MNPNDWRDQLSSRAISSRENNLALDFTTLAYATTVWINTEMKGKREKHLLHHFLHILHQSVSFPTILSPFTLFSLFHLYSPVFILPHFTCFPFVSPPTLFSTSQSIKPRPKPTDERGNLLSSVVEICHVGGDVASDLGRSEGWKRGEMENGESPAVPRWNKVCIGMVVT